MENATGPLSREQLQALANAPHGAAAKAIREHDPLWGRFTGEPIKWRVRVTEMVTMEAFVTVEARTEEEALEIAEKEDPRRLSWDVDAYDCLEAQHASPVT